MRLTLIVDVEWVQVRGGRGVRGLSRAGGYLPEVAAPVDSPLDPAKTRLVPDC